MKLTIENIKEITTKKNQKMLVGNITDNSKDLDFVIFPDDYSKINIVFKLFINK